MRTILLAGAAISAASTAQTVDADVQARFLRALALADAGQFRFAAAELGSLYLKAPTPRIRLELARVLMLSGQLADARSLFLKAYADNPPPDVKANIIELVRRIDQRRGRLTLNLGAAYYANPLQQPGAFGFTVNGIDLDYAPDSQYLNQWGITYAVSYTKSIASWDLALSGSFRDLPGSRADRSIGEASVGKRLGGGQYELRAGLTQLGQTGLSFSLPFVEGRIARRLSVNMSLQPSLRVGRFISAAGGGLSGWQYDVFAPVAYSPSPAKTFAAGPTLLRQEARFGEQAFYSYGARGVALWRSGPMNLEGFLQARMSQYDQVDPFWGVRRVDKTLNASVYLNSDRIKIAGLLPTLGGTCDLNWSTISFFNQRGCALAFELRRQW